MKLTKNRETKYNAEVAKRWRTNGLLWTLRISL